MKTRCTCRDDRLCAACEVAIDEHEFVAEHRGFDVDDTTWQQGQDDWERAFYAAGGDR